MTIVLSPWFPARWLNRGNGDGVPRQCPCIKNASFLSSRSYHGHRKCIEDPKEGDNSVFSFCLKYGVRVKMFCWSGISTSKREYVLELVVWVKHQLDAAFGGS